MLLSHDPRLRCGRARTQDRLRIAFDWRMVYAVIARL